MEIELQEICDFIAGIPPFDSLPIALLEKLTNECTIRYIRRNLEFPPEAIKENRLYILRKGSITLLSNGELIDKVSEGGFIAFFCTEKEYEKFNIRVDEDTLIYTISCDVLHNILKDSPSAIAFLKRTSSQRLNAAVNNIVATSSSFLIHTEVVNLMRSQVASIESGKTIYNAAKHMTQVGVSSLLICKEGAPLGILTDKDIRQRCVAANMSLESCVDDIMTRDIFFVSSKSNAYDALMLMTRKHIHHLPVIDNNVIKGIVTITDLMRQEGKSSAHLASAIRKSVSVEELQKHSKIIPQLQLQTAKMGGTAEHVGKAVTAITGAITRRLIQLAEEKFGTPPVSYAWVAAGSQARKEQTSHSDQDNGLIISNDLKEKDKPWFKALAKFVCDGLAICGFVYCPGDVMAINPKWRQTQNVWREYFSQWINVPEPMSLMYSSIFFDLRTIYGDKALLEDIRTEMLGQTKKGTLFLAHLTANALKLRPPLGFFRDFVLIHDGKHNDTLDLKHNGIAPIIDLARIYALSEGISAVNTMERLKQAAGTSSLSKEGAADLQDALIFIGTLRIKHQVIQIKKGITVDNYMSPREISMLERAHLKDAFKVIQTMQSSLENKY